MFKIIGNFQKRLKIVFKTRFISFYWIFVAFLWFLWYIRYLNYIPSYFNQNSNKKQIMIICFDKIIKIHLKCFILIYNMLYFGLPGAENVNFLNLGLTFKREQKIQNVFFYS